MEDLLCSACHKRFQDESPPKVLECGHNVCAKCLVNFLDSDSVTRCAICQAEITKKESWPTNHFLLTLSKSYNKQLHDEKHVKTAIAYFEEDCVNNVNAMKKEVDDSLGRIMKKVTAVTKEVNDTLGSIMKNVTAAKKEVDNALGSIIENIEIAKVETLKMDDFEDRKDYLYEVYWRCKTGLVYAIYIIEKEEKFGQVTVFGHKIRVHCASESILKHETNVTQVLFQDLKKSIGEDGFNVFLQIGCSKFRVEYFLEVQPIKGQSLQFVKLCTGETGPSYKGTLYTESKSYRGKPLLKIDNYISNGETKYGKIDYNLNYRAITFCGDGEYVVVDGFGDGRFDIIKIHSDVEYSDILGKIVPPCNFLHKISFDSEIDNKILDCGITFQIE